MRQLNAEFSQDELNTLATILGRSIEKTKINNRSPHDIHGEIYTRLRQELAPWRRDGAEPGSLIRVLCGKFKYLTCRLSERQKEQLEMLFNDLTNKTYSRYSRSAVVHEKEPEGIDALQLEVAKANKAVEEASQAAKVAEQVAQQIDALEQYIQEGV